MIPDITEKYWELPTEQLLDYVGYYWEEDENLDIGDALHRYFDAARPRDWLDVRDDMRGIWARMFNELPEHDSPIDAIFCAGTAASAAGVWDAVAEAFGLETKYVQLVLAGWYEYPGLKMEAPSPITWDEFMRRYEAEKAEWEQEDVK